MINHSMWSTGIETALNKIHINSLEISEYHTKKYSHYKGQQKYFRVPVIILSSLNSVFSVGLQPFVPQKIISILCCIISLLCGTISSLELFIGIQPMMEKELISSKEFYILSCDVFKTLSVERRFRTLDGHIYLDNIHTRYCNLIEQSDVINDNRKKYKLYITPIAKLMEDIQTETEIGISNKTTLENDIENGLEIDKTPEKKESEEIKDSNLRRSKPFLPLKILHPNIRSEDFENASSQTDDSLDKNE